MYDCFSTVTYFFSLFSFEKHKETVSIYFIYAFVECLQSISKTVSLNWLIDVDAKVLLLFETTKYFYFKLSTGAKFSKSNLMMLENQSNTIFKGWKSFPKRKFVEKVCGKKCSVLKIFCRLFVVYGFLIWWCVVIASCHICVYFVQKKYCRLTFWSSGSRLMLF